MPCVGDSSQYAEDSARQRQEIDNLTNLLCYACGCLEQGVNGLLQDVRLSRWWQAHQLHDRQRQAREEQQRQEEVAKVAREIARLKARYQELTGGEQ